MTDNYALTTRRTVFGWRDMVHVQTADHVQNVWAVQPSADLLLEGLSVFGSNERTHVEGLRVGAIELLGMDGVPAAYFSSGLNFEELVAHEQQSGEWPYRVGRVEAVVSSSKRILLHLRGVASGAAIWGRVVEPSARVPVRTSLLSKDGKTTARAWHPTLTGEALGFEAVADSMYPAERLLDTYLKNGGIK